MSGEFVIAPHMRLHEWVAVEKGYFDDEGLVYTLEDQLALRPIMCMTSATRSAPTRPSKKAGPAMSAAPVTGR